MLPRYVALYAALYAAYGVQSPFLPSFLSARGLGAESIGLAMAAGVAVRLLAGPAAGWLADGAAMRRGMLIACAIGALLAGLAFLPAHGSALLLGVVVASAALLAPLAPLADALALDAVGRFGFDYGWLRGGGATAFILATIGAGQAIGAAGIAVIMALHAALLAVTAVCALRLPRPAPDLAAAGAARGGFAILLRHAVFRRVVLVAALIQGSHALHDSFAVLRWHAAGIGAGTAGLLWAESVAGEVTVFLLLGRPLLDRFGPAASCTLAAFAGVVRWAVMAQTAWLPAVVLVQPLHGLTFALQHLACMRLLAGIVPPPLWATALTVYGTLGVGAATAALTLASGPLYAQFGPAAFWAMAGLCALALPLAGGLRVSPSAR